MINYIFHPILSVMWTFVVVSFIITDALGQKSFLCRVAVNMKVTQQAHSHLGYTNTHSAIEPP